MRSEDRATRINQLRSQLAWCREHPDDPMVIGAADALDAELADLERDEMEES